MAIDPSPLLEHKAALQQRMTAISAAAAELAGAPFNIASSVQLSKVLYEELGLQPPTGGGRCGLAAWCDALTSRTLHVCTLLPYACRISPGGVTSYG